MKQFQRGQLVVDNYGNVHTVAWQRGVMVFVYGLANTWFHPNKLHAI